MHARVSYCSGPPSRSLSIGHCSSAISLSIHLASSRRGPHLSWPIHGRLIWLGDAQHQRQGAWRRRPPPPPSPRALLYVSTETLETLLSGRARDTTNTHSDKSSSSAPMERAPLEPGFTQAAPNSAAAANKATRTLDEGPSASLPFPVFWTRPECSFHRII